MKRVYFNGAVMTEQRQDDRQDLEPTSLSVIDLESGVEFEGEARNVSGRGLMFHAAMEPAVGADMQVTLSGKKSNMRVLRVESQHGGFDVAGRITR